jgi:hypothetical protein
MASKIKLESDLSLARVHKQGALVEVVQASLHSNYGLIYTLWPKYWVLHAQTAEKHYNRLKKIDLKILQVEVRSDGSRVLDEKLTKMLYTEGVGLALNVELMVEHFCLEVKRTAKVDFQDRDDTSQKLLLVLSEIDYRDIRQDPGYQSFGHLLHCRHNITHPTLNNTYDGTNGSTWDEVPLAWIASGKAIKAWEEFAPLFEDICRYWGEYAHENFAAPATLTLQRGMKSKHSFKLSPTQKKSS